jgi:hypothetical protein
MAAQTLALAHSSFCTCGVCPRGCSVVGDWVRHFLKRLAAGARHTSTPHDRPGQLWVGVPIWVTQALTGTLLADEPVPFRQHHDHTLEARDNGDVPRRDRGQIPSPSSDQPI